MDTLLAAIPVVRGREDMLVDYESNSDRVMQWIIQYNFWGGHGGANWRNEWSLQHPFRGVFLL
jgi:hypothetical protein